MKRWCWGLAALAILCGAVCPVAAQDMLQHLDLQSPAMTQAEMTRGQIEALLSSQAGRPLDLSGKALNGLDLSGLDLSHAILRNARLNKASLQGAKLDGAVLDQAWGLDANFSGASLKGASLFASQLQGANLDAANQPVSRGASGCAAQRCNHGDEHEGARQ
ncbi:MAG: pentapeptide repeat-containing protein [Rhodomicrobium sp.]